MIYSGSYSIDIMILITNIGTEHMGLYTMYQANQLSYSKAQLCEWMMDALHVNDRGRALEYIMAE